MNTDFSKKKEFNLKKNFQFYFKLIKGFKLNLSFSIFLVAIEVVLLTLRNYMIKILTDGASNYSNLTINLTEFISLSNKILIFLAALIILGPLISYLKIYIIQSNEIKILRNLRQFFFKHIIHLSYKYHSDHKTGSLINQFNRGINAVEDITDLFCFRVSRVILTFLIVLSSVFMLDMISALVLLISGFLLILASIIILVIQKKAHQDFLNDEDIEKGNLTDFITNVESIKYFGKEHFVSKFFNSLVQKTSDSLFKYWSYFPKLNSSFLLVMRGTFFILAFRLIREFINDNVSVGTIVFILTTSLSYFQTINMVFGILKDFSRSLGRLNSLRLINLEENEIKEPALPNKLEIKKPIIEFKNVNFSYENNPVFENFNLKINENEKVALVGHSGSGKTTLVKLLYRFYDIESGEILIDNKNIKSVTKSSLRSEMSIVPQECILFDDTIYNNVKFSNSNVDDFKIWDAFRFSQLDRLIKKMPKQENTIVGERGVKLSGGEKQRVSIARAILADKKILVLDEATSALDSRTEHDIQNDLEKLMKGRTSLIIAHRLSTIMSADRIIVLKEGKIVQDANHEELLKQEGEYLDLWNLQKGGYLDD